MPIYDLRCTQCGHITIDVLQPVEGAQPNCQMCVGGVVERVWLPGQANAVIGDECDVEIKHGLCNPDGSPRRFRSKSEIRTAEKKAGVTNRVEHVGTRGGDRSKHTTRWI